MVFVLGTEMKHNLNNKKNNARRVATLAVLVATVMVIVVVTGPAAIILGINQLAYAITPDNDLNINIAATRKAPSVVSGDNIYIAWWTNNTANNNEEAMFRASNDGGATFGDKINLSNTTDADSW